MQIFTSFLSFKRIHNLSLTYFLHCLTNCSITTPATVAIIAHIHLASLVLRTSRLFWLLWVILHSLIWIQNQALCFTIVIIQACTIIINCALVFKFRCSLSLLILLILIYGLLIKMWRLERIAS